MREQGALTMDELMTVAEVAQALLIRESTVAFTPPPCCTFMVAAMSSAPQKARPNTPVGFQKRSMGTAIPSTIDSPRNIRTQQRSTMRWKPTGEFSLQARVHQDCS